MTENNAFFHLDSNFGLKASNVLTLQRLETRAQGGRITQILPDDVAIDPRLLLDQTWSSVLVFSEWPLKPNGATCLNPEALWRKKSAI